MNAARLLAVMLFASAVTGCAREGPPADVVDAQNALAPSATAPTRAPLQPTETAAGKISVRPGQTLYAVARDANVPVRALIDANQLQPPYKLREGQVLVLPRTRQHIVQPGETLYAVARQYGVEASTLARENHLNPPYTIKSGSVLMLPAPVEPAGPVAVAALPPPSSPPPSSPSAVSVAPLPPPAKPTPPVEAAHVPPAVAEPVHAPTPLQPANNAAAPPQTAPAPAPQAAAVPPQPTPAPAKPAPQAPAAPPPIPAPETAKPDAAKPSPAPEAAAIAAAVSNHPDPVAPLFQWPVRGRILSVFGTSTTGGQNDGINILAPAGTTVSAADGGTVAYAGNELRGFGNLLLIKHADGWVTAYAHNEVLLVKKGDKVRRGQPIARVGTTGGVAQAQLHFELRRGTKAIDPLDHLPQQSADAG